MNRRLAAIQRVLGIIVAFSSLSKLPPLLLALALAEPEAKVFLVSFAMSASAGLLMYWPVRHVTYEFRLRDGFVIVTLTWAAASVVSALPFMYAPPHLGFSAAIFEAASGLTTTGATIIVGLDNLPKSVLLFRQVLQFLGGMGIVILAVAILPMLKIGGTQLFRAESTGPGKDTKLTPRIAETAKALWTVYAALVVLCTLAFWLAGMSLFDAVSHAMSTVSTGGFSTYDASFGYWNNPMIDWVAIVFMTLGGVNFGLHYVAWRRATTTVYFADSELRTYLRIIVGASALIALTLWLGGSFTTLGESVRHGTFQVVSNLTTTGFSTTGFVHWAGVAPLLLIGLAFIGGCAGSTVGGIKVARVMMLLRQGFREVRQLVHPKGQFLVKMGGKRVSESVVLSVSGFVGLWMLCFVVLVLAMNATGLDILTSFGAATATLTNLGPGLGEVASNFASVNTGAVWLATIAMIMGRLEVFTVLVLLMPGFWRQ